jgi:ATPase family associated with various cellular activities (AAA)
VNAILMETNSEFFSSSLEHLLAELERIDLCVRAHVAQVRRTYGKDEQFRGLYISEEDVDQLLKQPIGVPLKISKDEDLARELETQLRKIEIQLDTRKQESQRRGVEMRLNRLQEIFQLDRFELDVILLCLAPEIDLRYERLYAYLQDDVSKKNPTVDLTLNLLLSNIGGRIQARKYFGADSPLIRSRLLEFKSEPENASSSLLATFIKLDPGIVNFLFEHDALDKRVARCARLAMQPADATDGSVNQTVKVKLDEYLQVSDQKHFAAFYFEGREGVGKLATAQEFCIHRGIPMLIVDVDRMIESTQFREEALSLVLRDAKLRSAVIFFKGFDSLFDRQHSNLLREFAARFLGQSIVTIMSGEKPWDGCEIIDPRLILRIDFPSPGISERVETWSRVLNGAPRVDASIDLPMLAARYKLTDGQIASASITASNRAQWRGGDKQITSTDLDDACRSHSNQRLSSLATKIATNREWGDIILPPDRLAQLRDICNHVKYKAQVFDQWGFESKLALGRGLAVLFAGPSGTGKTLAASIIAHELGLDLYSIDLSAVVSKYIGETEKNLSKIFSEAETSNAILFFDEADSLFGKRSEVKDSHDRYANIETGYLLQRLEQYDGMAILASNFRKNIDEAFIRRLSFAVEFPFPKEEERRRIWENIWPKSAPIDGNFDSEFLSKQFELTGGNIKNVALGAAYLASVEGLAISMKHVLRATEKEYQKMGKVLSIPIIDNLAYSEANC